MKIGILTYHWVYNFGANLQTLSTIGYLIKQGHTPIVINWIPEDLEKSYNKTTSISQIHVFKDFQRAYYPLTDICRDAKDIAKVIKDEKIDAVFIGADTLFALRKTTYSFRHFKAYHPIQTMTFPNPFWGEFLNYINVPIAAYSVASLSTKYWKFKKEKKDIYRYINRFKHFTVRDSDTRKMISFFTDGNLVPEITPDTVFSFNSNVDYSKCEKETLEKNKLHKKYVLFCIPEHYADRFRSWSIELSNLFKEKGYELIELPRQTGSQCFPINQLPNRILNPLEWYVILKNSSGFIGSLMHSVVSCIHNEVPFYSIDYYGTGKFHNLFFDFRTSKAYQIISDCGLTDYYYNIGSRWSSTPDVEEVVDKIIHYNLDLLHQASTTKLQHSIQTLNETINDLIIK